jgi:proteic killer suppression protein
MGRIEKTVFISYRRTNIPWALAIFQNLTQFGYDVFFDFSGIRPDLVETVERILTVLDTATTPQALNIPRYRLHPLKGQLQGMWSVTVRANWRIIFRFDRTDAFDVELIDYH